VDPLTDGERLNLFLLIGRTMKNRQTKGPLGLCEKSYIENVAKLYFEFLGEDLPGF